MQQVYQCLKPQIRIDGIDNKEIDPNVCYVYVLNYIFRRHLKELEVNNCLVHVGDGFIRTVLKTA